MTSEPQQTPPISRSSSQSSTRGKRNSAQLSLDLSDLPPLTQPTAPSNTLLITNLHEPSIFHPANLVTIRDLVDTAELIHTWAPLKSFSRIVVSFYSTESAIAIRQKLDNEMLMNCRIRVYFGQPTPLAPADQHLHAPKLDKLFFISPPPSPPHGWEMRNEEPPNKEVHADDLALALSKLHASSAQPVDSPASPIAPEISVSSETEPKVGRRRGSSTIVYDPQDHGDNLDLPVIGVEDTSDYVYDSPMEMSPSGFGEKKVLAHTMRPPVELMYDA